MEDLEQRILKDYPGKTPMIWLRFVDDTFIILSWSELESIFKYINEIDPNIKFTQEECANGKLAFLDSLVDLNSDRTLSSTVYWKPTHQDHYLQFDSHLFTSLEWLELSTIVQTLLWAASSVSLRRNSIAVIPSGLSPKPERPRTPPPILSIRKPPLTLARRSPFLMQLVCRKDFRIPSKPLESPLGSNLRTSSEAS